MPALIRRREQGRQSWHVYYGDVCIGWIGKRAGVPVETDEWAWHCGTLRKSA
jgi:hypothetical protein